jgi:hypothetical protein
LREASPSRVANQLRGDFSNGAAGPIAVFQCSGSALASEGVQSRGITIAGDEAPLHSGLSQETRK